MKNQGFTLLEMLISCMVIAILTSVSFWGYNAKKDTLVLRDETGIVVSKTENMREKAIGSQYWHEKLPTGGYGIFFAINTDQQYFTFADCDNNGIFDNDEAYLPCGPGFRERIETIDINGRARIKDIYVIDGFGVETTTGDLTIIYKFPYPEAIIKDAGDDLVNDASIVLEIPGQTLQEKTIHFNSAGLIYVE